MSFFSSNACINPNLHMGYSLLRMAFLYLISYILYLGFWVLS